MMLETGTDGRDAEKRIEDRVEVRYRRRDVCQGKLLKSLVSPAR